MAKRLLKLRIRESFDSVAKARWYNLLIDKKRSNYLNVGIMLKVIFTGLADVLKLYSSDSNSQTQKK